jgi:hypothetical protein
MAMEIVGVPFTLVLLENKLYCDCIRQGLPERS